MKKIFALMLSVLLLAFGVVFFSACGKDESVIDVYMPDGAPALSMAQLMSEENDFDANVQYHVVNANTIQTYVTGENPDAELCVLPVNAAAQALGNGTAYRMLGTVTHGNIFIISETSSDTLTVETLNTLVGKKIGCIQLNSFVGLVLKMVLADNEIEYTVIEDASQATADKVNLLNISDPSTQIVAGAPHDFIVAAEPVVSAKTNAIKTFSIVGNLQTLYGEGGYPQAVLVAKTSLIEENADLVETFTQAVISNAEWLKAETTSSDTIVSAIQSHLPEGQSPTFNAKNLSKTVIENCAIRFERAAECKDSVQSFLSKLSSVSGGVTFTMADSFFYGV